MQRRFPSAPILLADSGNFSDNPNPQGDVRTRALLEGMQRIGYQVVNVGERDIRSGWESFLSRAKDSKLVFLSSNIVDKATHKPVFDPYSIIEIESPDGSQRKKVGVIGVVRFNPIFSKPGPGGKPLAIVHPAEPVRAAVAALQSRDVDLTVLLSAMHRDDSARLVRDIPGIDFVLGSYGGIYTTDAVTQDETVLIYSGNQGKRVGVARVFTGQDGGVSSFQSKLHLLGSNYPSDPEMLRFVDAAHAEADGALAAAVGTVRVAPAAGPTAGRLAGDRACGSCHTEVYTQWNTTAHAHAPRTLANASVACETCHGPGRIHSANPGRGYGKITVARCATCHTPERSPDFDYYTDLAQVKHHETPQGSR